ncbi:uncharacterized protein [Drosophila takahashii]|uniref:uncharacterized protein n=1 Tax=Drosophila takahashii TaxID=29030 RepID=UPI0038992425
MDEVGGSTEKKEKGQRNNEKGGEQKEGKNQKCAENNKARENFNDAVSNARMVKKGNVAKENMEYNFNQSIDISLGMAMQVLSDFSGESCARKWVTQMNNIASIYGITGHYVKMLMISKIKGKANVWLHANSGRVLLPLEELTAELISMFGEKASKLEIRRKFENRQWNAGETFGSYADDKVMLAQSIYMEPEEMLDCIIEGIPNQGLRNQAHMQCFENVRQMKRAFADISLPKSVRFGGTTTVAHFKDNKETRCYNCNAKGHWASECRKAKREKGSCYACGEMGHFVATCLKNKNKPGGKNNYNAS